MPVPPGTTVKVMDEEGQIITFTTGKPWLHPISGTEALSGDGTAADWTWGEMPRNDNPGWVQTGERRIVAYRARQEPTPAPGPSERGLQALDTTGWPQGQEDRIRALEEQLEAERQRGGSIASTLQRNLDVAVETNRRLHRRLQALEGPWHGRVALAEREAEETRGRHRRALAQRNALLSGVVTALHHLHGQDPDKRKVQQAREALLAAQKEERAVRG